MWACALSSGINPHNPMLHYPTSMFLIILRSQFGNVCHISMLRGGRVSVRASSKSVHNIFQKSTDLKPTLSTMISGLWVKMYGTDVLSL